MIGTGGKNEDLSALGLQTDGLDVHVGYDGERMLRALQAVGLVVVADYYTATKALPTYLPEALISGVPALISTSTPATVEQMALCETFRAGDRDDLVRQLKRLMSDDQAYQKLKDNLPMDPTPHYDRSQSWGSGIARLLAEIYGVPSEN